MKPKLIALVVILIFALVILLQNTHVTTLRLLFWKVQMSQVVLVLIVLAIGVAVGFVAAKLTGRRAGSSP